MAAPPRQSPRPPPHFSTKAWVCLWPTKQGGGPERIWPSSGEVFRVPFPPLPKPCRRICLKGEGKPRSPPPSRLVQQRAEREPEDNVNHGGKEVVTRTALLAQAKRPGSCFQQWSASSCLREALRRGFQTTAFPIARAQHLVF